MIVPGSHRGFVAANTVNSLAQSRPARGFSLPGSCPSSTYKPIFCTFQVFPLQQQVMRLQAALSFTTPLLFISGGIILSYRRYSVQKPCMILLYGIIYLHKIGMSRQLTQCRIWPCLTSEWTGACVLKPAFVPELCTSQTGCRLEITDSWFCCQLYQQTAQQLQRGFLVPEASLSSSVAWRHQSWHHLEAFWELLRKDAKRHYHCPRA